MREASARCNIVLWNNMQVIKYESVIHEFDPYFNYRVTQVCFPSSETFSFFIFYFYFV
jgi:asparagine N-glycosylation enzyme membrane subunit Stt3